METTRYLSEVLKVFNLNRQETKAVQTKAVLFQLTIMVIEKLPKKKHNLQDEKLTLKEQTKKINLVYSNVRKL